MKFIEKIAEAQKARFIFYFIITLLILLYRAYLQDTEGMALCMAIIPFNLYAIINSPN